MGTLRRFVLIVISVVMACGGNAMAVDIEPGDYVPAPPGTNLFVTYFSHVRSDSIHIEGLGEISDATDFRANVGLLRWVRFTEIGGMPFNYQALLPVGSLSGQVAGGRLSTDGLAVGDPMIGFVLWPVSNHETGTYLGLASVTTLPWGSYDRVRSASLGSNAWMQNFQVVFTKKFSEGWMLDLAADVFFYGDNNDAGGGQVPGTLEKDETWQLQGWVSRQVSPVTNVGLGFSTRTGGRQRVDGIENGLRTEDTKIRASVSRFVGKTTQLQAEVNHVVDVVGGFDQKLGVQLRFLKVF